jgi:TonB family protein
MELHAEAGRYSTAFVASVVWHIAALLLLAMGARTLQPRYDAPAAARLEPPSGIVWLSGDDAGLGGDRGGARSSDPARQIEMRGSDPRSLPVVRSAALVAADPQLEDPPLQPLDLRAVGMARGLENRPGILSAGSIPGESQGPGIGPYPGTGLSDGPGLGPGNDRGWGGDVPRGGGGAMHPVLLREVRPRYTAHAMRARIQGVVELDAVVLPDGRVGAVRIVRSLDRTFGLDQEAIEAARQWRFLPGRRGGEPVAVPVRIELTFTLQ